MSIPEKSQEKPESVSRKELRASHRAQLGRYFRLPPKGEAFPNRAEYLRWKALSPLEREYLGQVLHYALLTSLHSQEARQEEQRALVEDLGKVTKKLGMEVQVGSKALEALAEEVAFLADAVEEATGFSGGSGEVLAEVPEEGAVPEEGSVSEDVAEAEA